MNPAATRCLLLSAGLLLGGCNPLDLGENEQPKPAPAAPPQTRATAAWTCTELAAGGAFVCRAGGVVVTARMQRLILPLTPADVQRAAAVTKAPQTARAAEALARTIADVVSNTVVGRMVRIEPPPGPGQALLTGKLSLSDGTDIGASLVRSGYALIAPEEYEQAGNTYREYQQLALEAARGLWASSGVLSNTFTASARVALSQVPRVSSRAAIRKLSPYHADDLFRAPANDDTGSPEASRMVGMLCTAVVSVVTCGAPRDYDAAAGLRLRVLAQENSGPLASFAPATVDPVEEAIVLRGGTTNTVALVSAAQELYQTVRANNVPVYSGHIAIGYEVYLTVGGETVFSQQGAFDKNATLVFIGVN